MKFGKRLKRQIEESIPEWRDKFLSYKDLKKLVRRISAAQPSSKAEAEFIYLLNTEIGKFNAFFMEQEEEFVIRQREIQERVKRANDTYRPTAGRSSEEEYIMAMTKIRKDAVNLHGEMVLLENYSCINYTGLAKILKKYDKRTGAILRLPFIEKVLKQPFYATDLISKLVKECERTMEALFPGVTRKQTGLSGKKDAVLLPEQSIFRNTVAALLTMQELRKGSSTHGQFSLPPLNLPEADQLLLQLPSPIEIL